ncbi:ifi-6-16 domain-containing [Lecanosticta acicola]|uniref:Ifi-6-16 domain-containing n=1 Tax=Lecanosticta acicola TaxID=111012 RepID=A0AAI8YXU6_9PEZI|nr:ifi-6-16 domain-containing [Lecanosticta acicola]
MAPVSMEILVAGLNFTSQPDFSSAFAEFAADRNPILDFITRYWSVVLDWISTASADCVQWVLQPHVYAVIIAWAVTFTIIITIILTLGFGPVGVGAGESIETL